MTTNTNRTFSTSLSSSISNVNPTNTPAPGTTPNPFGNSLQFIEVAYVDQLKVAPPSVPVSGFMPAPSTITADGLTLELWFKAESPGSLVSVPMSNGPATANAPLIYIDTNGVLRAGLFDSTQITLYAGQNLIAQNNNGVINVGALNTLKSPLSVVDSQWHHAALVVEPDANGTQSLFLDGRLAATGTANGSFGLSFVASDGTTWTANTPAQAIFGGPITPQPVDPPSLFQPNPQGFCGCLNELRTWYGPRSATGIQQLIDVPLLDGSTYQQEGLAGYAGSSFFDGIQTSTYLVTTPDAPPVDPFPGIDRVPGFQNYGICTAIPFTTVALEVTFQASQPYSTKISLCQTDQLQISFPNNQANGDDLPTGTVYSMTLTGGSSGQIQNSTQIAPGSTLTINANLTDCYRLDFTCSAAVTIDNLQFMLIPGPVNTLMQLLLDVKPFQAAYTDPNYPITPTSVIDQETKQPVTLSPYWPLFTDATVFPIDPTKYSADDLLSTYLNFNQQAREVKVPSGATFYDFLNLSANNATICLPSDLSTLLDQAYVNITGANSAPSSPPQAPFNTSVDQIYAFIYNVNAMRNTLNEFLTAYKGWAEVALSELSLANIPSTVANEIYNGQNQIQASLKGPSIGNFIGSLLVSSAIVGLGAVLGPLVLPAAVAATVSATTIGVGFLGGAGANALSEIIGAFWGSSTVQAKMSDVNYQTLADVVNNVETDSAQAYQVLITNLLDPAYLQTLFSNYGLLQALSYVSAQPLYDANQSAIQPGENNSLITGTTYASWKALIPSVFTWNPKQLGGDLSTNNVVFMVTQGSRFSLPYESNPTIPSSLGVAEVLQGDPWKAFYWMLYQIQQWQTGAQSSPSGGQFFSICPIFLYGQDQSNFEFAVDWVIEWSLLDTNQNAISTSVLTSLFGVGTSTNPLSLEDQNNPLAAAGYGWYCQLAKNAVTTPFDAFMNWGEGVPSYSPHILLAQYPENGKLYFAFVETGVFPATIVQFASAAAADLPPSALVTLPNAATLSINGGTVGQTFTEPVPLTNNQQNSLQNITATISGSSAFTVTGVPSEVLPNQTAPITIYFTPEVANVLLSATLTVTASGQYNTITLTTELSGILSESS